MATNEPSRASGNPETDQVCQLIEDGLFGDAVYWWETNGASAIVEWAKVPGLVVTLAGLIEVLREGADPDWVLGGHNARDALTIAMEWLDAGVDGTEVANWYRAGCWDPKAARQMVGVGIHPARLLDDQGEPSFLVDEGPDAPIPLAQAVADNYLTAEQAVRHLFARAARP